MATTTTTTYVGNLEEVVATSGRTARGETITTTAYYGGLALSVNGALQRRVGQRCCITVVSG